MKNYKKDYISNIPNVINFIMKKFLKNTSIVLIFSLFALGSCVPLKDFVYLQGEVATSNVIASEPEPYRIQPNDNLYIQVISNDELAQFFNLTATVQTMTSDAAIELVSYKVDLNGEIDFPYIGNVKVAGLTTNEIKKIISKSISERIVQYSVDVKLVNRSVSLLGEFKNPGIYSFYRDRVTIFEAIGMGKDLTDLANRHNVKIIRHLNGEKNVTTIDLTSSEVLTSQYYYILPNDVIYVEPSHKFYESKGMTITATLIGAFSTLFNIFYIIDSTFLP